jgi:hypothetical protein
MWKPLEKLELSTLKIREVQREDYWKSLRWRTPSDDKSLHDHGELKKVSNIPL